MRIASPVLAATVLLAGAALAQQPGAPTGQPDLTPLKADFVPGEKTLFYDDFSDMVADEPPPHWKVRGASMTLKTGGAIRQLTATDKVNLIPQLKYQTRRFQ